MPMRNKIKELLDSRGITRYEFWKKTGVAQRTAYDLYDKPEQYPSGEVMDKICSTYGVMPNDVIEWIPETTN